MRALVAHLRWLWSTRNCEHLERRVVRGEERMEFECNFCGKRFRGSSR